MCKNEAVCPYKDKECPKVDDVQDYVRRLDRKMDLLTKAVYILVGITLVQTGVMII